MNEYDYALYYFGKLLDVVREVNKKLNEEEMEFIEEEFFHNLNIFRFLVIDKDIKKGRNIPKKPRLNKCQICETVVRKKDSYCSHCGQKLDWSKE